jgi:signal transduction histidine kinase
MIDTLVAIVELGDEFVAIASHELKTPLSSLVLQLDRLQQTIPQLPCDGVAERERLAGLVDRAVRQADRLASLVNDLLDASRISAGKVELHREEVDLAKVVGTAVSHWHQEAERVGCALVGSTRTTAMLRVRDHGPGISPDRRALMFEKFARGANGRGPAGFGLGLYITRQMVEAHGGKIAVESEIGTGSTFVIELPRQPRSGLRSVSVDAGRNATGDRSSQ